MTFTPVSAIQFGWGTHPQLPNAVFYLMIVLIGLIHRVFGANGGMWCWGSSQGKSGFSLSVGLRGFGSGAGGLGGGFSGGGNFGGGGASGAW